MTKPTPRSETPGDPELASEVIDRRLRELAQLYKLGVSLRSGRWVGRVSDDTQRPAEP